MKNTKKKPIISHIEPSSNEIIHTLFKNKSKFLEIASWSLFDFADTIFSMNVVSLYFALWIVEDCQAPDLAYSFVYSTSMLLVAIFSPIFGVIADRSKNVIPILALITTVSCVSTFFIGVFNSLVFGLILFLIANFAYQSALVFYNYLLPVISNEKNQGFISGIGVSLGYVGAIAGILLVKPFVIKENFDKLPDFLKPILEYILVKPLTGESSVRINAFIPTAIFFLIFSIPCFIFVKAGKISVDLKKNHKNEGIFKELFTTLKTIKEFKNIFLFLLSNLLFMDAVHTVIIFMSVFASKAICLSDGEINNLLITSTIAAIFGAFFWGIITDKLGHKKTLIIILLCWILVMFSAAITYSKTLFYGIGALCGISLGGVWVSTRPLLISIVPKEKMGEFFGLYGLTGKCAAIMGPMLWGLITYILDPFGSIKYRVAMLALGILVIAGFFILRKVQVEEFQHSI
jgi:MFS transporter, UMF1 family